MAWLKQAAAPFAGQTVRLATESTPPSNAINTALKPYFEEATGIKVEIEVLPLEQVLQKLTLDVASGLGTYDLYYLDQSWMASFSGDVIDPREKYEASKDLAMPNYNFDDFLQAAGRRHLDVRGHHGRRALRHPDLHPDVPPRHL